MITCAPIRWFPRVLLMWIGVAVLLTTTASADDARERLVQRTYNVLALDQEFASARHEYLKFLKARSTSSGYQGAVAHVGDRLITSDYRARISSFLANPFSDDELSVIADYFESRGGQEVLNYERRSRSMRNHPGFDANAEARRFAEGQPKEDQSAFRAFNDSAAGRRFQSRHQELVRFVLQLVGQLGDEILAKMAAEHTSRPSP